jgi:hypothetical protein
MPSATWSIPVAHEGLALFLGGLCSRRKKMHTSYTRCAQREAEEERRTIAIKERLNGRFEERMQALNARAEALQ